MIPGFLFGGEFMEVQTRRDLYNSEVQAFFGRHRYTVGQCTCRAREGVFFDIILYTRGENTVPKRAKISDEHHIWCVTRITRDGAREAPEGAIPSDSIFLNPPGSTGAIALDMEDSRTCEVHLTYRAYVGRVISDALVRIWSEGERIINGPSPSAAQVLNAVQQRIETWILRSGRTAPQTLSPHGCAIVAGIITQCDPIINSREDDTLQPLVLHQWQAPRTLQSRYAAASGALLSCAKRSVSILGGHIPGPYFFIGVWDAAFVLTRLAILPVYFDLRTLMFVDSGQERTQAGIYDAQNALVLKPTQKRELLALGRSVPALHWMHQAEWPSCPDWIVLGSARPVIVEQRGFPTKDPRFAKYTEQYDVKAASYRSAAFARYADFLALDGTNLRSHSAPVWRWDAPDINWRLGLRETPEITVGRAPNAP